MKLTLKQHPSPIFSNKQNSKQNLNTNLHCINSNRNKQQGSYRHRNDHSIQAKSPIKIPMNANIINNSNNSAKKQDLTFRNKTQQCVTAGYCDEQTQEIYDNIGVKNKFKLYTQPAFSQNGFSGSMKININQILSKKSNTTDNQHHMQQKYGIAELECGLVDDLWQICNRLSLVKNDYIKQSISIIQVQVRKMLAIIAKQNYTDEAPLASSKKIKLQNCIAQSHCQKQADQKQIDSDQQSQSNHYESQKSHQTVFSQRLEIFDVSPLLKSSTPKQCSSQQLETKKIMYMLDGKQAKPQITPINNKRKIGQQSNSNGVTSQRISSLSSFNQNSCDDSGFTVFQIQRLSGSERMSRRSNIAQPNQQLNESDKKFKKLKQPSQQFRTIKKQNNKIDNQTCQSGEASTMSVGSKRKILNDIVAMLNHKYNKNIRLE